MTVTGTAGGGSPADAGTRDTRVDRIEEGLPGIATVENPTASPASRGTFDAGRAGPASVSGQQAQIDTALAGYSIDPWSAVKRGKPGVW